MKLTDFTKTQFIFLLLCVMRLANVITAIIKLFKPTAIFDDFSDIIHKIEDWLYIDEEESNNV